MQPVKVRKNCPRWHDEDLDRFVVVNGKRLRWSPAAQNQLARQQEAIDAARAAKELARQQEWFERRQQRIADLKLRPNYKTAPCQNPNKDDPEMHDRELCAFSHGDDYNAEGARLLALNRKQAAAAAPKEDRHVHASERRRPFDVTRESKDVEYDSAFPSLTTT